MTTQKEIELQAQVDRLSKELLETRERLESVYNQRNNLAVAFAWVARDNGLNAGRGIDGREHMPMDWRHVVYVDLHNGKQVSWHISPSDLHLLELMPQYDGVWDGKFTGCGNWSKDL